MAGTFNKGHERDTECSRIWQRKGPCMFRAWGGSVSFENALSVCEDWGGKWGTW